MFLSSRRVLRFVQEARLVSLYWPALTKYIPTQSSFQCNYLQLQSPNTTQSQARVGKCVCVCVCANCSADKERLVYAVQLHVDWTSIVCNAVLLFTFVNCNG